MRFRAIRLALWYGFVPWWWYEDECHYAHAGYLAHLRINLRYALTWALDRQTFGDVRFEATFNTPDA